jgi:hypothetical protein
MLFSEGHQSPKSPQNEGSNLFSPPRLDLEQACMARSACRRVAARLAVHDFAYVTMAQGNQWDSLSTRLASTPHFGASLLIYHLCQCRASAAVPGVSADLLFVGLGSSYSSDQFNGSAILLSYVQNEV